MSNCLRKIMLTGGDGQLATAIKQHAMAVDFELIALSSAQLNITQKDSIQHALDHYQPDAIINTAAYTAVDKAESDIDLAMLVNSQGARLLAQACQEAAIPLIHISTDYIFDGSQSTGYKEEDPANPINQYGKSKWLGEQAIRDTHDDHLILRISGVFSEYRQNFLKTILRLAQEKPSLRVVDDQITCPTYAGDIAGAILHILNQKLVFGTYHYCSSRPVSWYGFAKYIIDAANSHKPTTLSGQLFACSTTEYPTPAKRPPHSILDCSKIHKVYQLTQPQWENGVQSVIQSLMTSTI
jgi:dTDP-4-dehydrorhamnose reductase